MRHATWLVLPILALAASARADGPADVLDKAPSKFAKSGDVKVHYKSLGEGKTAVVFVHGWCCDLTVWRDQAAALDGKVRMLFVDLPGYGLSDKPKIEYTPEEFAKGVEAVVKDAGVEHAVLVGHSMGTPVVRQFYRLFPDRTKAARVRGRRSAAVHQGPGRAGAVPGHVQGGDIQGNGPEVSQPDVHQGLAGGLEEARREDRGRRRPAGGDQLDARMLGPKWWDEDPVKVPAQALMAKSQFWTDDYKAFVKKLVPDLDYREFDGVGHFLFMEKPKEFNAALAEFLQKQGVMK